MEIPESMLAISDRDTSEPGWRPEVFQQVLTLATKHRLACLGGQFQFRGPIGISEMYWIDVDSEERWEEESWDAYVLRANREVSSLFEERMKNSDFDKEAMDWKHIRAAIKSKEISDPKDHLFFIAYFNSEPQKV